MTSGRSVHKRAEIAHHLMASLRTANTIRGTSALSSECASRRSLPVLLANVSCARAKIAGGLVSYRRLYWARSLPMPPGCHALRTCSRSDGWHGQAARNRFRRTKLGFAAGAAMFSNREGATQKARTLDATVVRISARRETLRGLCCRRCVMLTYIREGFAPEQRHASPHAHASVGQACVIRPGQ